MIAGSIGRLFIRNNLKRDGNESQSETKPDLNRERKRQSFKLTSCKHQLKHKCVLCTVKPALSGHSKKKNNRF